AHVAAACRHAGLPRGGQHPRRPAERRRHCAHRPRAGRQPAGGRQRGRRLRPIPPSAPSFARGTRMNTHINHHLALRRGARTLLACTALALAAGCAATGPATRQPAPAAAAAPAWSVTAQAVDLPAGVYQGAYSARSQRLYVASATGRPPVKESRLLAIDPAGPRVVGSIVPAPQASRSDGQVQAVYGLTVDDARSQIWTTNTRSGSVAVYRQSDLSLVKQFP